MAKLQIFIDKALGDAVPGDGFPHSQGTVTLRTGFFVDDYSLIDVTADTEFTITFGKENISPIKHNQFFMYKSGDVGIKAFYRRRRPIYEDAGGKLESDLIDSEEYIATTSFVVIADEDYPNKNDIYACIKREEPDGVYNQAADTDSFTYLDNQATADIFATNYNNLRLEANQVYPELTTDYTDWINLLFSDVYINPQQGQINKVMQLLRNLQILTSMNPFDIATAITSYIYYRTDYAIYVFIQEDKVNFDTAWILGTDKSILGVNTYLSDGKVNTNLVINVFDTKQQLNDLFRIELENFINKITRVYFGYTIDYTKTPVDFGLLYDVGMTYKGDPRIIYSYCLCYSQDAFYAVVGLINPIQPAYIKDLIIQPASATVINLPTKLTVTGIFIDGVMAEVTLSCQINKNNNCLSIVGDVLIPKQSGICTLIIKYGDITKTITYVSKADNG